MWTRRRSGDLILEDPGASRAHYFHVTKLWNPTTQEKAFFDFLFERFQPIVMATGAWGRNNIPLMMGRKQSMRKALRIKYNPESHFAVLCQPGPELSVHEHVRDIAVKLDHLSSVHVRAKSARRLLG